MSEENIFAAMLREHAHKMDMECAPEESDFWAAADHIYLLERQLYAANSRIEELEQKLRTTSLEALAISDTNNEMAIRIAELEGEDAKFEAEWIEANRGANYFNLAHILSGRLRQMDKRAKAANKRADVSQARLSEAVKVLKSVMPYACDLSYDTSGSYRADIQAAKAFITTLGGEKQE